MKGATVLVTGATGFIGSHLVERLVSEGASVRCLVRPNSSRRYLPFSVELVYGELVTGDGLRAAVEGADFIFHLAGVTKAIAARQYYDGNVRATGNLLRACAARCRLLHVSSLAAVGPSLDGVPVTEDSPPHPLTHYGKSKLQAEQVVKKLAPSAVIVRPPVVYGPRDTDVLQIFRSASKGWLLRIGAAESYFSVIYVKDLVDAMVRAARTRIEGSIYFAANREPVSWSEFGKTAAALMDRKLRVVRVPVSAAYMAGWFAEIASRFSKRPSILSREKILEARQQYWICDTARAEKELGFIAATPLREGMAETLAWYQEAGWLKSPRSAAKQRG